MKYILIFIICCFPCLLQAQHLDDYIQMAIEQHPMVKQQQTLYKASLSKIDQVSSLKQPMISAGYFISPIETRVGPQQARFGVSQSLPWFGTLATKAEAAHQEAKLVEIQQLDIQNQLALQVRLLYYQLMELKQLKALQQERIELFQTHQKQINSAVTTGEQSISTSLQINLELEEATTNLNILQEQEKALHIQFNRLIYQPDQQQIQVADSLPIQLPNKLDSLSFNQHPLMLYQDQQTNIYTAKQEIVKKESMPQFQVGVDYLLIGKRTDAAVNRNGADAWMPKIGVQLPVFKKQYSAQLKALTLHQEAVTLKKVSLENDFRSQLAHYHFQITQQLSLLDLYQKQLQQLEQILAIQLKAYSNAEESFTTVLEIKQKLISIVEKKVTATTQLHQVIAQIKFLTESPIHHEK